MQLPNISDPDEYTCLVEYYGHEVLVISVNHRTDASKTFYLKFVQVFCFSGMPRWRSVKLRIGLNDEYQVFLQQLMPQLLYEDQWDTTRFGQLYIFETENGPIKLIAKVGQIVNRFQNLST